MIGTPDLVEYVQQLSDRSERKRKRAQLVGIELQVSRTDRHVTFDIAPNPDDTATTEVGFLRDADQGQSATTQRMAGVNDGDRLLRRKRHIDRGSVLVEVSPSRLRQNPNQPVAGL